MAAQPLVPSENWDDDFEFSQSTSPKLKGTRKHESPIDSPLEPRFSVTSSHFSEDWDADERSGPLLTVPMTSSSSAEGSSGIHSRLENWAEPGPSTPTKRLGAQAQAENWDDDFEDKADSPPGRRHHPQSATHYFLQHNHHALRTRHSYHTPSRPKHSAEPENWDDDFDDPMDPGSSVSPSKTDNDNTPVTKRTRRDAYADSSDEDDAFGFSEEKEEDKTVTARSRSALMLRGGSSTPGSNPSSNSSPPPPVPLLPHALSPSPIPPFPRSPTTSVFSIPTTSGRNSIGHFNSTSHLVLSGGSSLGMGPPSPPHRERRRLRKKSRPPHMDNNVFELIEEHLDSTPPPLPPSTPERDRASSPFMVPTTSPFLTEATSGNGGSNKTPLLSRIGSVKKWGVRRKRASTGPAEVMSHELRRTGGITETADSSRPTSSLAHTQTQTQPQPQQTPSGRNRNSNWFFRPGGALSGAGSPPPGRAAELKHEKSLDQARLRPGAGSRGSGGEVPTTPSKSGKLARRMASGMAFEAASSGEFTGEGSSSTSGMGGKPSLGPNRRPTSMQVPHGAALTIGGGGAKFGSVGTRHASYGSSIGRTSASRVFSTPTPTESVEDIPPMPRIPAQDGSRGFMGSVRKISLVGGKTHKKKKSSTEAAYIPPPAPPASTQDRSDDGHGATKMQTPSWPQSQTRTPELLPPIELQPPSPPQTINGVVESRSMPLHIFEGNGSSMILSTSVPVSISMSPRSVVGGVPATPVSTPTNPNKHTPKSPGSPQSASLGRATQAPNPPVLNSSVPRRNSLGDLKIPARISQAQIGLKRDLGMVREFAASVDRLKELQLTYHHLLTEVQTILESAPPSRAASPSPTPSNVFNLVRPRSRLRSNASPLTNDSSNPSSLTFAEHKQLVTTLHAVTAKYKISWECAELLIELGGGTPTPTSPPVSSPGMSGPSSNMSTPSVSTQSELDRRKNRERAVTLSGDESKPPPASFMNSGTTSSPSTGPLNPSWRASTGRHDLSQRQIVLLRDMLSSGELPPDELLIPEDSVLPVNRNWRWGDAMSSTITLPSEESGSRGVDTGENTGKKKRGGKIGMSGLRDILRMLKRSYTEQVVQPSSAPPVVPSSTASLSTESSLGSLHQHYYSHQHGEAGAGGGQRRSKPSTGPDSIRWTKEVPANSPYGGPPLNHKSSPRRPSLASIFRIGQKNKGGASSSAWGSSQDSRSDVRSASRGSNMSGEEDWDKIDSLTDLNSAAMALGMEGTATIRGRRGQPSPYLLEQPQPPPVQGVPKLQQRPVTPRRGPETTHVLQVEVEASPRSIRPMRSTRLSNVEEVEDGERQPRAETKAGNRVSLLRTSPHRLSGSGKTASVRSAPPQPLEDPHALPELKLAMTPENIKPLLESAKEVHTRCCECLRELHALLDAMPLAAHGAMSPPIAN